MEKDQYSESELATMLHNAGLRPSVQRISIFSLIANSRLHPSAEEIYSNLWHRFPSLSRILSITRFMRWLTADS